MKELIFKANNDWIGPILRLTLAIVMIPHAIQHTTGGLGGFGYTGFTGYLTDTLHIPWLFAFFVVAIEVIAPILLLLGLASRVASISLIILMIAIILSSHIQHGFFMNWLGNQRGEGFEYHLLYIGLATALTINGSGKYAIDQSILD